MTKPYPEILQIRFYNPCTRPIGDQICGDPAIADVAILEPETRGVLDRLQLCPECLEDYQFNHEYEEVQP